ncbi:hypothetical protein [Burkholderia ubonensis]|uniref:hypothetical protein n=1 Tax=Burkholderia ubonensis TaxID=101571 RepID=UPI000AA776E0|nr:hypothetical protein [Burkholderia ubonensis]
MNADGVADANTLLIPVNCIARHFAKFKDLSEVAIIGSAEFNLDEIECPRMFVSAPRLWNQSGWGRISREIEWVDLNVI